MKAFLKWVGGKQRLLSFLCQKIPLFFKNYHEPMVGGGSLFFELAKRKLIRKAFLSDANLRLVRTYLGIKKDVEAVISILSGYSYDPDFYVRMRELDPDSLSDFEVAAWFLYLNRTCYNGLYRVNKKNRFNTPFGKYKNPVICNGPLLRACSEALQNADIFCSSFETVSERTEKGDFVYFDPPYIPLSPSSNFTSYTPSGFGFEDHVRLRDLSWDLRSQKKVFILLSNSWTELTLELYGDFQRIPLPVRRAVSATKEGRKLIHEALIW